MFHILGFLTLSYGLVILSTLVSTSLLLFSMYQRGKSFQFEEEKWNHYFQSLTGERLFQKGMFLHFIGVSLSCFLGYRLYKGGSFKYPLLWTSMIFIISFLPFLSKEKRENLIFMLNEIVYSAKMMGT